MPTESEVKDRFLRDIQEHELTVIRDDGVYRHLRFQKPGTSVMYFDLITWPGHLCFTGDMGSYLFSRVRDMCDVRFTPTSDNHRCCCARCRARRSRERKQQGPGAGQVAGCRIVRGGAVSVTVHLPADQQDRIHELATGQWVQVTPHGER